MALFDLGKKAVCGSDSVLSAVESVCSGKLPDGLCSIKVLGLGCKTCHEQLENVKTAVKNLGLNIDVEYITDMEKISAYGAMSMPAIVINEKVVSMGKLLKAADIEKLLGKLGK